MGNRLWGPRPKWENLPTELIRAIGQEISFKPWEEATVRPLCNGEKMSSNTLYELLLHYLDCCKRGQVIPLDLSLSAPSNFSVESLAKILIRIAILIKDGDKPFKDRIDSKHLSQCRGCKVYLLQVVDVFLVSVEQHLNSNGTINTFYQEVAGQLLSEDSDLIDLDKITVNVFLVQDPSSIGNFESAFIYEMEKAVEAGVELSKDYVQQLANKAAALSNLITSSPKPSNPWAN